MSSLTPAQNLTRRGSRDPACRLSAIGIPPWRGGQGVWRPCLLSQSRLQRPWQTGSVSNAQLTGRRPIIPLASRGAKRAHGRRWPKCRTRAGVKAPKMGGPLLHSPGSTRGPEFPDLPAASHPKTIGSLRNARIACLLQPPRWASRGQAHSPSQNTCPTQAKRWHECGAVLRPQRIHRPQ
mgnify:CR=1 FL=1